MRISEFFRRFFRIREVEVEGVKSPGGIRVAESVQGTLDEVPEAEGLISPEGMRVVASVRSAPGELSESDDRLEIVERSESEADYPCGHRGSESYRVHVYGLLSRDFKGSERCPDCRLAEAKEFIIRCALCGLPIVPGDSVAMYYKTSGGLKIEIGHKIDDSYVGCLRWDCCPSGGLFVGHWTGKDIKPYFSSGLSTAAQVMSTGRAVVVNDMSEK